MGSLWWWVFRTCVLPGWVAGLILWRTSSLASRRLDSRNGAKVVKEVTLSKVVNRGFQGPSLGNSTCGWKQRKVHLSSYSL